MADATAGGLLPKRNVVSWRATPGELPTAGRGKSAVRAGRGTSPASRTQVATSAGSIISSVRD